jgi:hypothetical protein
MRFILVIFLAMLITGCSSASKRNKWQKKEDFVERRSIYYNDFVESGGMAKDDDFDQVNPMKREIQNALNSGKTINHIS